jgi:diguanylate cyclase (GGDEF)-like protein/PAS domain S-box-containing protein
MNRGDQPAPLEERLAAAERGRRDAEIRFRKAFEHAPIGVALIAIGGDPGRVVEVNRALCTLTGYSDEELVAAGLDQLTVPEDLGADAEQRRRLRAGEIDSFEVEKRLQHKRGHQIWCQMSISLIPAENGEGPFAIVQLQDVSERRRSEQRLQFLADHDSLTGLVNRRRFRAELERQVGFNSRYGGQGALLVIDVDSLKSVNDAHGHHAGDNLIRRVADILRERVRTTDTVARLAGDEFAVLMPQVDEAGALQLAEDVRVAVSERAAAGQAPAVTASIGITMFGGERGIGAEAVLVAADLAMYRAKEEGRDRVSVFQDPREAQRRPSHRRETTAARIRDALTRDRLSLDRQPIFDLATGKVARHELLLRMGTNGDVLPAARFIEIAEKAGMVQELDRWVVVRALSLATEQQQQTGEPVSMHVNLSGASITDISVLEFIERQLDETDADPSRITFEITETAAIRNFDTASALADRLTEFGCEIAIDDYGAGFGPFYYLKHLPFDLIKIDGDFVRDLPRSDADQLTVRAIVQIARGLGKRTIAEFVQDDRTAQMLREYGVDMAQGFHLGAPSAVGEHWAPA